jgi:PBP1b-binding outer membrane lipoprotein LpoB
VKKNLFIFILVNLLFISGCASKPQVKYIYIKEKCPTLQKVNVDDLNLSHDDKPLQLHIKVK